MINRRIPAVMFSQHPDHAARPFWSNYEFIKTHEELKECFLMFSEIAAEEAMWDWEGKLVDEAVIERLLGTYTEFFRKKILGKDVFLTFRVPNPRVESGYRLGRAFMVILSAQATAKEAGFSNTPLFEVILPMTENAREIINVQTSFNRFSKAARASFGSNSFSRKTLDLIPIFENIETILGSSDILKKYASYFEEQFKERLEYIRPFCARSDPSLNSGIVPTTLAIKWALSEYKKFTKETGIETYPIIAPGALPFRGGLTPQTVTEFIKEFSGIKTLVIQSAFRYDYPLNLVKIAIKKIIKEVAKSEAKLLSEDVLKEIKLIIPYFEKPYRETVEQLAPIIDRVSKFIPQRRERVQHIGLFGYSRQMGKVKLPRAIGFTASCYSLGIPPELIGTGRGLRKAKRVGKLELIESLFLNLKPSLIRAGGYLRKESITELRISEIWEDIKAIEEYLGQKLGPETKDEIKHAGLVKKIMLLLNQGKNPQKEIEQAAILRHSLG